MGEVLLKENNLIDLSSVNFSENYLYELTNLIENKNLQGQNIKLNLGNAGLSLDNFENILSVLNALNVKIEILYSESKEIKISAIERGLTVSGEGFYTEQHPEEQQQEESSEPDNELEELFVDNENSTEKRETLYVKQTLRSGQKIEFDGNIILIGDCNAGSEIIASGDIIIWGILSGIAHAGNKGDKKTCIRAFKINAIQLRIADLLARKPDMAQVDKVEKSDLFNPEEAKVFDDEIIIYSLHQDYY